MKNEYEKAFVDRRNLDFRVGELVEVRNNNIPNGRKGIIIGINLNQKKSRFIYTVKFSSTEAIRVEACCIRRV